MTYDPNTDPGVLGGSPADAPIETTVPPAPPVTIDQKQVAIGNIGVPTQVANPRRASWRTIVQSIIGLLVVAVPLVNVVLGQISDYLQQQTDVAVPGWVWIVLNAGLAVTAVVSGLIARIMNTPGVADFIAKYLPFLAPIKQAAGEHEA